MATILETINTVTDKIVALVGTRANKDLSNLTQLGEAKLVSGTSGLPVGSVIAYMGTDVPTGYLLMDGRTLSRTTYAALFAVIGTTQGAGDGSTTFGIADMTDGRYLMGSTVAGGSVSEQLPAITGSLGVLFHGNQKPSGCISVTSWNTGSSGITNGSGSGYSIYSIDAKNSSSIYSGSRVYPRSRKVLHCIKYV